MNNFVIEQELIGRQVKENKQEKQGEKKVSRELLMFPLL